MIKRFFERLLKWYIGKAEMCESSCCASDTRLARGEDCCKESHKGNG